MITKPLNCFVLQLYTYSLGFFIFHRLIIFRMVYVPVLRNSDFFKIEMLLPYSGLQ
jgi:hypothetical protein